MASDPWSTARPVYLDHHSTTPLDPEVREAMLPFLGTCFGNPSNRLSPHGRLASQAVAAARAEVADLIGAVPEDIVFTSGATEANNLALRGVVEAGRARGVHLVTQSTEHPSVLRVCETLAEVGTRLTVLPVDPSGHVDLGGLARALEDGPALVSIMLVNNEIGTIHRLQAIRELCRSRGALLHSDATQAAGRLPISIDQLGVDLLSLSAHKVYGPMGVGALYVGPRARRWGIAPQTLGGGQEDGLRAGTLNVPGIVGFGAACRLAQTHLTRDATHIRHLTEVLFARLMYALPGLRLHGPALLDRVPGNLNLGIPWIEAKTLLESLGDISISTGSACATSKFTASHVLRAIGLTEAEAGGTVRIGLGRFTTLEEVEYVARRLVEQARALQALARPSEPIDLPSQTQRAYDQIATTYAKTWFDDGVMEPLLDRFSRGLPPGAAVLDAGCGPGRDVAYLRSRGFEAIGIDRSEGMLAEARNRVPNGLFRQMDLNHLSYPPESFEGVWACGSLVHIPREGLQAALRGFARVLKPGGRLAVSVIEGTGEAVDSHGRYFVEHPREALLDLLVQSGFDIEELGTDISDKSTSKRPSAKKWIWVVAERRDAAPMQPSVRGCVFCPSSRFESARRYGLPAAGSILWGDDHLYIAADVAPVVEGHLLVASVAHRLSFGSLEPGESARLEATKERIRELFRRCYGSETLFFEHGSSDTRTGGACIEHAHLHCLPIRIDVRELLRARSLQSFEPCTAGRMREVAESNQPYIYVSDRPGEEWLLLDDRVPSQFLRQLVTGAIGGEVWRWQDAVRLEATQRSYMATIQGLSGLLLESMNTKGVN